jgi:CDP-glucose 4,6-dehydratase
MVVRARAVEAVGLSGRSTLVTGAYGLLGSWLVKALLEAGARVTVVRRDEVPRSPLILMGLERSVTVVNGDICDAGLLERTLAEHQVQDVFHLAAQTIVETAASSPLSTFETNIRGSWLVLESCRRHAVERVLIASSDKAYGASAVLPYLEDFPLAAVYPYDVSKAASDLLARCYWHTWQVPVAVTRFANLYGGGDTNESRLIPEAVAAALAGRSPVLRSDGSPERDFLYVEDAVAAYLAISEAIGRGEARGEAFNAGGGGAHRVLEVVELICRLVGSDVAADVRGSGTPAGEIDRQWVDFSKLRELTGWEPRVTLEEGLGRTIAWEHDHAESLLRNASPHP